MHHDVTLADVNQRLHTHEAVCMERWENIRARMVRIERIIVGTAATLIVGMATVVWQVISIAKAAGQ